MVVRVVGFSGSVTIHAGGFLKKNGSGVWKSVDWWRIVATVLMLYGIFLDFTVSEKENDVSNEVEKQVPGVPDGYRLVGIRAPKKGEFFITSHNMVMRADENWYEYCWPVVELIKPIEPSKSKTEEVVLNKYLVNDGKNQRFMIIATAEYMDTNYVVYKLIGPSETIEVEVGV
jgi:hypothetical protein